MLKRSKFKVMTSTYFIPKMQFGSQPDEVSLNNDKPKVWTRVIQLNIYSPGARHGLRGLAQIWCVAPLRETYWSRIKRWTVRKFWILIAFAVKTCKQCLQITSASGKLRPLDRRIVVNRLVCTMSGVRTDQFWAVWCPPVCRHPMFAYMWTPQNLPFLFKMHEIYLSSPDVKSKTQNVPNSISATAPPHTPLGELTALHRPLAVFKGPTSEGESGAEGKWREKIA